MTSRFKGTIPLKPRVDAGRLAAFAAGADVHSQDPEQVSVAKPSEGEQPAVAALARAPIAPGQQARTERAEKATESFLLRLTPSQMETLDFVFQETNVKSRQKLVESILIPELERRAAAVRATRK